MCTTMCSTRIADKLNAMMNEHIKEKINIRLPKYQVDMLRKEAEAQNRSLSYLVRELISNHIIKNIINGSN